MLVLVGQSDLDEKIDTPSDRIQCPRLSGSEKVRDCGVASRLCSSIARAADLNLLSIAIDEEAMRRLVDRRWLADRDASTLSNSSVVRPQHLSYEARRVIQALESIFVT